LFDSIANIWQAIYFLPLLYGLAFKVGLAASVLSLVYCISLLIFLSMKSQVGQSRMFIVLILLSLVSLALTLFYRIIFYGFAIINSGSGLVIIFHFISSILCIVCGGLQTVVFLNERKNRLNNALGQAL